MKPNYKRTILIGLAFMSILAFWQFYDQVIPYVLENVFGLQTFAANAIMSIDKWNVDLGTSSGYLLTATVSAIAAFVPLGFLSRKLGRKCAVLFGIILMTICYAVAMLFTQASPLMYLIFALVGIGWASINVNSFPMVVEMCKGSDVGKYTGLYYTFAMAAQITTPLLSGLLIDKRGFGYVALFPYAVLFSGLSFVTMLLVKHGDVRPREA